MQWLREYKIRQRKQHAAIERKLDRVEVALASLESRQLGHSHQHADADDEEASQMASGPSAQTLIERGVMDGYSQYISGR